MAQMRETRAQILLKLPCHVAQFEFSLSSRGYLHLTQYLSVISEYIAIAKKN